MVISIFRRATHLHSQKEKVEVEAAVQDIFVGDSHENAAAAVCQNGHGRAVAERGRSWGSHLLRLRGSVEGAVGLSVAQLDGVVSLFVIVVGGHCGEGVRFLGGRGCEGGKG
jgi:hypothetical protein